MTTPMDEQEVLLLDLTEGVLTLTLHRPARLNAMDDALSSQLIDALRAASVAPEVRVVVITGSGKGFCAGLDLSDPQAAIAGLSTPEAILDELGWVGHLTLAIAECNIPVIAAINGIAAGAGMALTLACDLQYMADSARMTTGYIRRGLSPDAGMTYYLPRLVGPARAAELIMTGRDISAAEAVAMGLVNGVYEHDQLLPRVLETARQLAGGPPIALTLSKRLLRNSADSDLATLLKQELASIKLCFATEDVREGVAAFVEKRAPNFQGR